MAKNKMCQHPEGTITPGKFYEKTGSFMTLGPRTVIERHVVDWCSLCGAIRVREDNESKWGAWITPKVGNGTPAK